MKFPQLPIGQAFSYQGEGYVKTGPVTGRNLATGAQRMIPRSALVEPQQAAAEPAQKVPRSLDPDAVLSALDALEARLQARIATLDPKLEEELSALMTEARRLFLVSLDLTGR